MSAVLIVSNRPPSRSARAATTASSSSAAAAAWPPGSSPSTRAASASGSAGRARGAACPRSSGPRSTSASPPSGSCPSTSPMRTSSQPSHPPGCRSTWARRRAAPGVDLAPSGWVPITLVGWARPPVGRSSPSAAACFVDDPSHADGPLGRVGRRAAPDGAGRSSAPRRSTSAWCDRFSRRSRRSSRRWRPPRSPAPDRQAQPLSQRITRRGSDERLEALAASGADVERSSKRKTVMTTTAPGITSSSLLTGMWLPRGGEERELTDRRARTGLTGRPASPERQSGRGAR